MVLTAQNILWLVGLLAFAGWSLWPASVDARYPRPAVALLVVASLAITVEVLFVLASLRDRKRRGKWHWIPALLCGSVLAPPHFFLYVAILAGLESARFLLSPRYLAPQNWPTPRIFASPAQLDDNTASVLRRFQTHDGRESLEATVAVQFAAGQKIAAVHVPFCPLFPAVPKVETYLEQIKNSCAARSFQSVAADRRSPPYANVGNAPEPPDASVTEIHAQPFGVRVEIKRSSDKACRYRLVIVTECNHS